ncbi:MotA/TolQ/ExbB proton channel family protein [Rasiella rasia]|uniref:MotA/TolQ/ExbB proton channel family protein n=1 Tax=Rasiella rasia TaxID=2744027 RepID=A0A6G6GKU2_9FLAO|nr:MotA/TolQ/ExbB proton channel family protein [Rasiella rasia]QIE59172.1 MotA/TolQ/ExbB proton channel family protein [Rasiella rasia]
MPIPLNIISDGGVTFMVPLILFVVIIFALLVVALLKPTLRSKFEKLINHISLFALAWGLLGSTIGLITAFDAIQAVGDISNGMMAGGLKVALITTLFGLAAFLLGRFALIIITLSKKE